MKMRSGWLSACALATSLAGNAWAQNEPAELPSPAPNASTNAVEIRPGEGVFRPDVDGQDLLLPADMPNLKDIPPMPMAADGMHGGIVQQQGGRMLMYDAKTGRITETPAAIVKWKDDQKGGGFDGLSPAGNGEAAVPIDWAGTMSAIADSDLDIVPWNRNCKLAMRWVNTSGGSSWYVCSGTMIDAETVICAGHCVYSNGTAGIPDGFAAEIYVYPGWDGNGDITPTPNSPPVSVFNAWGYGRGTFFATWSTWANNGDFDGDVGLIRITRAVGMLTGWYGWNYGSSCATIQSRTYNNASYPAEFCGGSLHTGAQMYYWFGQIDSCPNNQLHLDTVGGCLRAVWGGMSGSSMYYIDGTDRYISAVCSTSNRSTSANYCRLFEGIVTYMNDTFIPGSRGSVLDLQALNCNLADTTWAAGTAITGLNFNAANPTNNNPPSQQYSFNIYLSSNLDISTSDTLLSQQSYTYDYAAMQNVTVNCAGATIPLTVAPGTYYVGVVLDTGTGGDADSSNNDSDTWDAVQISVSPCVDPPEPTGVVSTNYEFCDRIELNWTDIAAASSYRVYRNTVNNSATAVLKSSPVANIYNDTDVVAGTQYFYWVKAVYPCGTSGFSLVADGYLNYTPAAPTGVAATDGTACDSVTVSWVASARAADYLVYRNTANNTGTATQIAVDTASPYVDNTGTAGQTYYYWVRARNACGTSGFSTANTGFGQSTAGTPANVQAGDGSICSGVPVSWNAVSNADTYTVYRNTVNNSGTAAVLASVNVTSIVDGSAVAGQTYFYWVRSSNECGTGGFSASNSGYRLTVPAIPTGVAATDGAVCTPAITVSWNVVTGATSYKVYRNTLNNPGTATLLGSSIPASFVDGTALPSTPYFYWVKSSNACGDSGFSLVDGGNRGGPPSAPGLVLATDGSTCRSVTVSWAAVTGATNYRIFRNTVNNSATATQIANDNASPYIDNTVVGATVYFYWVKAENSCGVSGFSSPNSGFGGTGIAFDTQPANVTVFEGQDAVFSVDIGGVTTYQWRRNGSNISNGAKYSGVNTDTLTVMSCVQADEANYSCFVTSPCGNLLSNNGRLTVDPLPCPADYNNDGGVDGSDVQAFFDDWEAGLPQADVNFDGGVDGSDVDYFFLAWENGGCV